MKYDNIVIMGVGKGQQRRVRASTVSSNVNVKVSGNVMKVVDSLDDTKITYSLAPWHDWLKEKGIDRVKLLSYYLGNERVKEDKELTTREKAFVLREVFIDAVNAGAIQLPKKMDPKDFHFEFMFANDLTVKYAPGGNKKFKEKTAYFPSNRIHNHPLNDTYYLDDLLYELSSATRNTTASN